MKRVTMPMMATVLMFFVACKEERKISESPVQESVIEEGANEMAMASFKDDSANALFENYQKLRVALVETDSDKAKMAAEDIKMTLGDKEQEVNSLAEGISKAENIEKQRELFSQLTEKVEPIFKATIEGGEIYKQFCPMAFEGKGGYWISDASEIKNPYFGDKMLTCGKVTETIN